MVLLGLILLAAAVVAAVELILANRSSVSVSMWDWHWQMDKFWLAVVGAGILLAAVIGLGLMRSGFARSWRLRRERRELAAENRRLAEQSAMADAPREETVVPEGRVREPVGQRVSDRIHHDRNHDGIDDRAEMPAAPRGAYPADVPPESPYSGPTDRLGHVPPSTAPDPRAAGWTDGRHAGTP